MVGITKLNSNLGKDITLVAYGIANGNQSTNIASTSSCSYTFSKKGKAIVQLTNNFNGSASASLNNIEIELIKLTANNSANVEYAILDVVAGDVIYAETTNNGSGIPQAVIYFIG